MYQTRKEKKCRKPSAPWVHARPPNGNATYACNVVKTIIRMRAFRTKMADCIRMASMEGALDLCNVAVSEKTTQIVWPPLPAEYVTVFSGRTDTPEVRCDLRQTHRPVTLVRMRGGLMRRQKVTKVFRLVVRFRVQISLMRIPIGLTNGPCSSK